MRLAPKLVPALIVVLLASCSSPGVKPETTRLAAWTTQLRDSQPEDAFAAVYNLGDAQLIFVGALHENQTDSATFRMINDAYTGFEVDVVIAEGYPTSKGANPPRLMEYAREEARNGYQEGGESVPTIAGAVQEGAQVWGGEPDDIEIKRQVLGRGFSEEDVLGYYILRVIPQWIRERRIDHAGDERLQALVDQELPRARGALALESAALPDFAAWASWYQATNSKPIAADFATEEVGPLQNGSFRSNMLAAEVSRARDVFLHELVIGHLQAGKTVLVVFGGSHLMIQRPALDAALGLPCYTGPDLKDAPARCRRRN